MKHPWYLLFLLLAPVCGYSQSARPAVSRFLYRIPTRDTLQATVDTLLPGSQIHLPLRRDNPAWADLGNTGTPALSLAYRPVRNALNPILLESFDGYGLNSGQLEFYPASKPFTLLNYNSGGASDKNGQTIGVVFAKNTKQTGNLTVIGDYNNSDGHFSNQKTNASRIHANYLLKRKHYSLVTGLSRYVFGLTENGGLKSDDQLTGTAQASYLSVNLSGASSKSTLLSWQGVQRADLRFGGKKSRPLPTDSLIGKDSLPVRDTVSLAERMSGPDTVSKASQPSSPIHLVHVFNLTDWKRNYADSKSDASFYTNSFLTEASKDSLRFTALLNDISLQTDTLHIGKLPLNLKGGINPDLFRYLREDSVFWGFSFGLNAEAATRIRAMQFAIRGRWMAAGYSAGDFDLDAGLTLPLGKKPNAPKVSVNWISRSSSPDPLIRNYRSNRFQWTNDFRKQTESGVHAGLDLPAWKASLSASFLLNVNRIYFDTLGLPAQTDGAMTVYSLRASKQFKAGPFRSNLAGLVQYAGSDAIRLPLFVGSVSTFMHHEIHFKSTGGELQIEYGFDAYFHTAYQGYGYMPATGAFYVENEKLLGNYPCVDVFAQFRVKRTRVFAGWFQALSDVFPQQSMEVLHYPTMRPHFKYGVYWHFYD